MTTFSKATLKTFFETGDIPTGQNFADLIDSYVNIVETSAQGLAGDLSVVELAANSVSASRGYFTNQLTIGGGYILLDNGSNIQASVGNTFVGQDIINSSLVNVYTALYIGGNAIVSAAGSAQATAANVSASISRLQGVVDGQTTGFRITKPDPNRIQYIINETAVSANLWPSMGCKINGNAANQVFPIAGNTMYTIVHTNVSGYGVK